MEIKKEFVHREIAGDHVLVPVGRTVREHTGLFPMTETAARIWDLLPDVNTEDEIVEKLLEEYDVERETLENDVKEFMKSLSDLGII